MSDVLFNKYVQPYREKSSLISMMLTASRTDYTDLTGFGPDRSTKMRCSGRTDRAEVSFGTGSLISFAIEHLKHDSTYNSP